MPLSSFRSATCSINLVICLSLPACSGSRGESAHPEATTEPSFERPLPELGAAHSRLSLSLELDEHALAEELARAVPVVLAKESGRTMGAPGKVSYEVRRGGFSFETTESELLIRTELKADISVCKPLGPLCLHYGACQPTWSVEVRVPEPLPLSRAPAPILGLGLSSGCVLRPVGYDATPELRRITLQQARKARAQMKHQLNEHHRQLLSAYRDSARRVHLGKDDAACLDVDLHQLRHTPIEKRAGALHVAIEAQGTLNLGCRANSNDETPPPDPTLVRDIEPTTELVVFEEISFTELQTELEQRLKSTQPGTRILFKSGESKSGPELWLGFSRSAAEPHWLELMPRLEDDALTLRPRHPETAPVWLTPPPRLPLSPKLLAARSSLTQIPEHIAQRIAATNNAALKLDTTLAPHQQVKVGPSSLQLILGLRGDLHGKL